MQLAEQCDCQPTDRSAEGCLGVDLADPADCE
jgi:hypothetical protein